MSACINDINAWNQDKAAVPATCPNLPSGGPATSSKVCNDYSNTFGTTGSTTALTTCLKGFCAAAAAFGRRMLSNDN
jgi:hypothetical protein